MMQAYKDQIVITFSQVLSNCMQEQFFFSFEEQGYNYDIVHGQGKVFGLEGVLFQSDS